MTAEQQRINEVYAGYASSRATDHWSTSNPGYAALVAERDRHLRQAITRGAARTRAVRVLDLGCGTGSDLPLISEAVGQDCVVIGLELRFDALRAASDRDALGDVRPRLVNGDACALPFREERFDIVVANTVFSSILDERVRLAIATEVRRVLKPSGEVVVYDMRVGNPSNAELRGVGQRELRRLFPGCELDGSTLTVVPQLARSLPRPYADRLYSALARVPMLRSHRVTRVRTESRRTTVLHVTSAHSASDPRIFVKECQTLARAGYAVSLAAPGARAEELNEVTLVPMPVRVGRRQRFTRAPFDANRVVGRLRPDIVHFHDPDLLPMSIWWKIRGRRVVYDAHESLSKDMAHKPYLSPALSRVAAPLIGVTESTIGRRLTHVVAATPAIAAQWSFDATVVANYPVLTEWAGIDSSWDAYESRPRRGCYVGVVHEERCTSVMVDAAARTAVDGVEFVVAGPLDMSEPFGPGVRYIGVLDRVEVAALFGTCRFGVVLFQPNPNVVDALPTKILEYMAAGLPMIVSRSLAVGSGVVDQAGCGIVVDHDDPAAVASAIGWFIDNPEEAWRMGQSGREAVLEHYSWSSQAERLLVAYDQKIAPRPRSDR